MALKSLMSFSAGELTPELHDNVSLSKFQKGLETARNVMISKTGSILSRFPRANFVKSKNDGEAIVCFSPPNSNVLLEFGPSYVRTYNFAGSLLNDSATPINGDLANANFVSSKNFVYILIEGETPHRFDFISYTFATSDDAFGVPFSFLGTYTITPACPPTVYEVEYAATLFVNN